MRSIMKILDQTLVSYNIQITVDYISETPYRHWFPSAK